MLGSRAAGWAGLSRLVHHTFVKSTFIMNYIVFQPTTHCRHMPKLCSVETSKHFFCAVGTNLLDGHFVLEKYNLLRYHGDTLDTSEL